MKNFGFSLCLLVFSIISTGVSGCDNRSKIAVFTYSLSQCPKGHITPSEKSLKIPERVRAGDWEVALLAKAGCEGFYKYRLNNRISREGGLGTPDGYEIYVASSQLEKQCKFVIATRYDFVIVKDPRNYLEPKLRDAVNVLAESVGATVNSLLEFSIIDNSRDWVKKCGE